MPAKNTGTLSPCPRTHLLLHLVRQSNINVAMRLGEATSQGRRQKDGLVQVCLHVTLQLVGGFRLLCRDQSSKDQSVYGVSQLVGSFRLQSTDQPKLCKFGI